MTKILLIEDDKDMALLISDYLKKYDITCQVTLNLQEIDSAILKNTIDLVVLDLMLPSISGIDICKRIRENSNIPIIISSAKGEISDKTLGFEYGADDYLAKPYEPRELVLRINAILKRVSNQKVRHDEIILDNDSFSCLLLDERIELSMSEFYMLKLLIQKKGKTVSREEFLDVVPSLNYESLNRTVDVHISKLRQKLNDDPKNPIFIKSVWGAGYMFLK